MVNVQFSSASKRNQPRPCFIQTEIIQTRLCCPCWCRSWVL